MTGEPTRKMQQIQSRRERHTPDMSGLAVENQLVGINPEAGQLGQNVYHLDSVVVT